MPIKSFRGKLIDNAIDTIVLHTNNGSTGYRLVKFELMFTDVVTSIKSVVKIYKTPQTTVDADIDFSDNELLGVGLLSAKADQTAYPEDMISVFDGEIFNQDIYITHAEVAGVASINYYIELEQIKLSLDENTVATLKDIRNITG